MPNLKQLRLFLERKKGERNAIERNISESESKIEDLEREVGYSEEAQAIIQAVGRQTQKQLEYRVGELVSLAQASVFDDPWKLKLDFVLRRGRTECDLNWVRGDGQISRDLMYGGAGGESDVAAFGLQMAVWSLQRPRTRNVIFLDEPLKGLKGGDFPEKGALMMKEISKGLKIQIIYISHIIDQIEDADRIFMFEKKIEGKWGVANVEERRR